MRQELIAYYRRIAGEAGKGYEEATLWAMDEADTDLRTMQHGELRQHMNDIRAAKRPVVKDVKIGRRFTSRRDMAEEAKAMAEAGTEVLGYQIVHGGDTVATYSMTNNSWDTGRLAIPRENGFYVVFTIGREV